MAEKATTAAQLKRQIDYFNAMQLALKLVINGTYGAFGNEYFVLSNKDIAGAITAMGRNLIQFMDRCNQDYWYKDWHNDTELHAMLGIDTESITKIDDTWYVVDTNADLVLEDWDPKDLRTAVLEGSVNRRVKVSEYADTDSLFVTFKPGMDSCGWLADEKDPMDFIKIVSKHRLQPLFAYKLDEYASKFKVHNIHNFELERINRSIVFLGKKMYVQNVMWEDGRDFNYEDGEYLFPKGVHLTKSSTPPFARRKALEIVKYLLTKPGDYSLKHMMDLVKDIKRQFELADVEDISLKVSCNNYDVGVIDDTQHLSFAKGAHFSQKAAGLHNFMLNQHTEYKGKYDMIKSGNKISYYYCKHPLNKMYGYIKGALPKEIAPPVDYDTMFQKIILNQVNSFIDALGLPELNSRLRVAMPLFMTGDTAKRMGVSQSSSSDLTDVIDDGEEW